MPCTPWPTWPARRPKTRWPRTTSKARHIPERFLLKVLKPLVSARVLVSIKGPNGGYKLAKPAGDITMADIVEAVDGPIRGMAPFSDETNSPLNKKLEAICQKSAEQVKRHLETVRVSELVSNKRDVARAKQPTSSND